MMKVPMIIMSRVTGYFSDTKEWNPGKRSEFANRKLLKIPTLITSDYKREAPQKGE